VVLRGVDTLVEAEPLVVELLGVLGVVAPPWLESLVLELELERELGVLVELVLVPLLEL